MIPTAKETADPVYSRLRATFGYTGSVVYFVRRHNPEYVKIGVSYDLFTRTSSFLNASPEPVHFEVVIPGDQALEHYFHRRYAATKHVGEWYSDSERILDEARGFLAQMLAAYYECWDVDEALLRTLRIDSKHYADVERLYCNGVPLADIAELAGISIEQLRYDMDRMRAIGFNLAARRSFGARRAVA